MSMLRRWAVLAAALMPIVLVLALFAWRYDLVYVAGESMRPTLKTGDLVVVAKSKAVGSRDVVLVQQPGHSKVLHRALRREGSGWETKGDANPIPDWEVAQDGWIEGPVVAVVPAGTLFERWQSAVSYVTLSAQPKSDRR